MEAIYICRGERVRRRRERLHAVLAVQLKGHWIVFFSRHRGCKKNEPSVHAAMGKGDSPHKSSNRLWSEISSFLFLVKMIDYAVYKFGRFAHPPLDEHLGELNKRQKLSTALCIKHATATYLPIECLNRNLFQHVY